MYTNRMRTWRESVRARFPLYGRVVKRIECTVAVGNAEMSTEMCADSAC